MDILYYIANFLILAGLIALIGRKMIVSLFRDRRHRIENDLCEAEEPLPPLEEPSETKTDRSESGADSIVDSIRHENEMKLAKLEEYTALECNELDLDKNRREQKAIFALLKERVREKYDDQEFAEAEKRHNAILMEEVLSRITLTAGDMSYLKHHDVLYVTLTSAAPLPEDFIRKVEAAATALLDTVGGKISYWVREDPALIGGFSLRIGDTIYDGTVTEHLYLLFKAVEKKPLTGKDTVDSMLAALAEQIGQTTRRLSVYQVGRVISVSDGICWMDGLADIMYGEVVEFDCGERGMVLDIQKDKIGCVIFGRFEHIESFSRVRRVGRIASVPVGDGLLGRVLDAIGDPIDGKGYLPHDGKRPIEFGAPAILDRGPVSRPLETGIKAIDAMVPIGKGQRELIIGDRQTGKTSIALDTILNQKGKNVICIYVSIGQKESTVADFREKLEKYGAAEYTVIVSGSASDSAAMQYIAPFAATAIGEYYMYAGKDVLIVYDDLSKHAVAYRELSLLLQRPSGREAYPGDIFYLHSRLLERSAQLSAECGGGSMTALPIIETQAGDISSYIPTNVISITDGQIFLESELFHAGQRPAVNVGLSVSRVGGAAQTKVMKQVAADLRTKLAQYRELAEFTQFGADIDEETRRTLNNGEHMTAVLKQGCFAPLDNWKQVVLLFAVSRGYADGIDMPRMAAFEPYLYQHFEAEYPDLLTEIKGSKKLDPSALDRLSAAVAEIIKEF